MAWETGGPPSSAEPLQKCDALPYLCTVLVSRPETCRRNTAFLSLYTDVKEPGEERVGKDLSRESCPFPIPLSLPIFEKKLC